jgi:transcriptional regulator with XRE-family HTH domain
MSKKTNALVSTNPEALKSLEKLGLRIRANRIAQNRTVKEMSERLFCSQNTYRAIEAGKPTASIGLIVNTLWLLGNLDSLDELAPTPLNSGPAPRARRKKRADIPGVISEDDRDF